MRDRSLFAVVLAIVAGVFFWPGASRRAEQSGAGGVESSARGGGSDQGSTSGAGEQAHEEASGREGSRHGGAHPHVSSAMLLLLADYLALDPHPEAGASASARADHDEESELSEAQADRLSREIREAAKAGGITIEPLIATLPDPIESHARWMFDRYLDGLSRGVAASGYVMDRYGPESWWTSGSAHGGSDGASGGGGSAGSHALHHHEGEPGVILYRTTNGKRLLVLLIVTETATAGIHAHATMTALDSAASLMVLRQVAPDPPLPVRAAGAGAPRNATCCTVMPERTLKFVGPTFSGSAVSVRTAVNRWLSLRTDACWGLRIVSGSISSVVSRTTLGVWDRRVTFQATVPDDDALQDALFSYVKAINGGHGERVAWIVEDNTTFGASLNPTAVSRVRTTAAQAAVVKAAMAQAAATQAANEAAIAHAAEARAATAPPATPRMATAPVEAAPIAAAPVESMAAACRVEPPDTPPEPRVRPSDDFQLVVIPFPMHVSRLHGAAEDERAQAQARSKSALAPQTIVPLRLADSGSPRDAFPAMTPELTFASVETALASLLDTIHSEHIRLVSIMATDTRDKLFLAEQIAQRAPDALLFTFTTDILFLHPDVNDNVRGMLVASAYPLNPVTQPWTPHDPASVLQMHHNTAQGIYNATLAVLGAPDPDTPVSNNFTPLLDYGAPGPIRTADDEVTGPAIWVSSVGRDTFWPVAIYDMHDSEPPHESFKDSRLIKVRTTRVPRYPVPHLTLSPWACAFFVALSVAALLHVGAYSRAWWRQRPERDPLPAAEAHPRPAARTTTSVNANENVAADRDGSAAGATTDAQDLEDGVHAPIVWNDCDGSHRRAPVTVYQLVCVAALWTFFTIPVTLSLIWLKAAVEVRAINEETPVSTVIIAGLAALLAVIAWVGLTALAVALAWTTLRRAWPWWWTSRREARGWPTTVRLLLWVIALVAVGQCAGDVFSHLPMTQTGLWAELPYFMRVTTLGNGVSPVVTYFLLTAAFYAWGVMNLRRFATPTPMLCVTLPASDRPRDWRIPLLRGIGFDDPEEVITKFQCRCTDVFFAVPSVGPLAALASAIAIYVVILGPTPLTLEGPTFGSAVVMAMIVLHVITGLAVFQFYLLWRTLHGFLGQLAHDGLLDAFEILGRRHVRVISAGISLRGPRDIDHFLAEHSPAFAQAMAADAPRTLHPTATTSAATSTVLKARATAAAARIATSPVPASAPSPPSAWAIVTSRESRESFPPAVFEFLTQRAATSDSPREDVTVATLLAFAIQQILTRLGELLAFATAATLLVIVAFGAFPFGRGPVLDGFGWLYVFILAGTALLVFIQVARDPILGRLKGYDKPGAFNWDRDLLTKLTLYAGIPLFGFISSQFPWLGRVLSQWLQPMQQALPWQ